MLDYETTLNLAQRNALQRCDIAHAEFIKFVEKAVGSPVVKKEADKALYNYHSALVDLHRTFRKRG